MVSQIGWKNRLIMFLFILLVGILGGMVSFFILMKLVTGSNSSYVEKVTEKQVYLENSSKIEAIDKLSKSLVSVVEESKLSDLLKLSGTYKTDCFDISSGGCGLNGVVLSGDGLTLLPLGAIDANKTWVAIDNSGEVYDLLIVSKHVDSGLLLAKLVKHGERLLKENMRTKYFNFKPVAFTDLNNLAVGQELLMLKNNFFIQSANVKTNLISSLFSQQIIKNGQVFFDADQFSSGLRLADSGVGVGMVLSDLGGQMVGYVGQTENGQIVAVDSMGIEALIGGVAVNKDSKKPQWGLIYSLNNKNKQKIADLPVDYGLLVEGVKDIGAAEKIGLKTGDLILEVDGKSLLNANLSDLLLSKSLGDKLQMGVVRAGKKLDLVGSI